MQPLSKVPGVVTFTFEWEQDTGIHTVQHDKCNYQFGRIFVVYIWGPLYLSIEFSMYVISSHASCSFNISIAPARPDKKCTSRPSHLEMLKAGPANPPGDLHAASPEPSFSSWV